MFNFKRFTTFKIVLNLIFIISLAILIAYMVDTTEGKDQYGRPLPPKIGKYRVPFLTADAVVLRKSEKAFPDILMITRGDEPFTGSLAFPGGHIDYNEDPEVGVLRELEEECNIKGTKVELLTVRGAPDRDPRRHTVSIVYLVEVPSDAEPKAGDDAATAKFYPLNEIWKKRATLAFDHGKIIETVVDHLKVKDAIEKD